MSSVSKAASKLEKLCFTKVNTEWHSKQQVRPNNEQKWKLTSVVIGSKLYDPLSVGEFLAHTFHIGNSLFILLSMWASYSLRESLGMLAAQAFTMTPETKHSPTSGTEQTMRHTTSVSGIGGGGLMRRQSLQRGSV